MTIIEFMVALAVLGAAASVMIIASNLLRWVQRQVVLGQIQQQAQVQLYSITRDIRNAQQILYISSGTLVLRSFNFNMPGGYDSPNLFDQQYIGTITYHYTQSGENNYLNRRTDFKDPTTNLVAVREQRYMRNILVEPTATEFLFSPLPLGSIPPYDSARVTFRIGRGYFKDARRDYSADAQVRSRD